MKRRMKMGMLLLLALLMMLPVTGTKVQAKSKWYNKVKKEKKKEGFKCYKLLDINKDGKKELILLSRKGLITGEVTKIQVWTRHKKTNKLVLNIQDEWGKELRYSKNKKSLVLFYRAAGENHLRIFKLKKGKLKTVKTWDWYCSYHYPPHGMNKKAVYMINGKKVSRK